MFRISRLLGFGRQVTLCVLDLVYKVFTAVLIVSLVFGGQVTCSTHHIFLVYCKVFTAVFNMCTFRDALVVEWFLLEVGDK